MNIEIARGVDTDGTFTTLSPIISSVSSDFFHIFFSNFYAKGKLSLQSRNRHLQPKTG